MTENDLSKQRQCEDTLHQSEDLYRAIYRDTPCMFFTLDPNGIVTSVNEFGASELGYTVDELIGKPVVMLFHDEDKSAVMEQLQICLQHPRQVFRREFRKLRRDAALMWIDSFSRMVVNADGQPNVLAVCQDITERKKAEEMLRHAFAKERELSELKSRFVSMASHEFRTPLATILASADMIGAYRHRMSDTQIDQKLDNIRAQVDYLKNIVEDVLQYTTLHGRSGAFKPNEVDLDLLCREIIDEFKSQPQTEHRLDYTFDGTHQPVMLDKRLMRQIIINLISNAIKYSPAVKPILLSLRQTSDWLILSIRDEGIGIPDADIYRLFEPFHRATNAETIAGTGLGLTIVQEAVNLHGGTIKVESQPGAGTTFIIRMPVNDPPRPPLDLASDMEA